MTTVTRVVGAVRFLHPFVIDAGNGSVIVTTDPVTADCLAALIGTHGLNPSSARRVDRGADESSTEFGRALTAAIDRRGR